MFIVNNERKNLPLQDGHFISIEFDITSYKYSIVIVLQ